MQEGQLKIKSQRTIKMMAFIICLGTFISAFYTVCVSQVAILLQLKNQLSFQQTIYQLSVSTSLFNLGKIIGPLLYKKFTQKYGFLRGLLILDILSVFSILLQTVKLEFYVLSIGRFSLGLVVGLSLTIVPVYLRQISPVQISGKIGSYNQVLQVIGVFFCYCIGYILNDEDQNDEWRWRVFLGIPSIIIFLRSFILNIWFPYDSISRYVANENYERLEEYCRAIYEDQQLAKKELIKQYTKVENNQKQVSSEQKIKKTSFWNRKLMIGIVIIASNQLTGINGIMYYTKQLFNQVTNNNYELTKALMIILAFLQIVSAYFSGYFIDRIGRKKIILNGILVLIGILMGIFVLKLNFVTENFNTQKLVVVLIFSHIFVHNMTLSPVCIVYCAQIVEDIAWIIITLKICSFFIAMTAQYMIEYLGFGNMFFIFGVISILIYFYLQNKLQETKGLTKTQIDKLFQQKDRQKVKVN